MIHSHETFIKEMNFQNGIFLLPVEMIEIPAHIFKTPLVHAVHK